jgi:hypothetical protein
MWTEKYTIGFFIQILFIWAVKNSLKKIYVSFFLVFPPVVNGHPSKTCLDDIYCGIRRWSCTYYGEMC